MTESLPVKPEFLHDELRYLYEDMMLAYKAMCFRRKMSKTVIKKMSNFFSLPFIYQHPGTLSEDYTIFKISM